LKFGKSRKIEKKSFKLSSKQRNLNIINIHLEGAKSLKERKQYLHYPTKPASPAASQLAKLQHLPTLNFSLVCC